MGRVVALGDAARLGAVVAAAGSKSAPFLAEQAVDEPVRAARAGELPNGRNGLVQLRDLDSSLARSSPFTRARAMLASLIASP